MELITRERFSSARDSSNRSPASPSRVLIIEHDYPEGGLRAWLVVFGAWCAMFPCMGLINTFGVLHAWISQHELADHSEFAVGWVFSVYAFVVYFAGVQVGRNSKHS